MARPVRRYQRESPGLAFDRVAFFTDAVFAIALTLIVVGIGVPEIDDTTSASALWHGLGEHRPEFIAFALGVLVIGFYWRSHHEAFDQLSAVDGGYVMRTVVYLGVVAFLPYPIRLVGQYASNPVAWALFALNLAAVSAMEAVLLAHGGRAGLRAVPVTPAEVRWETAMSLTPVPLFLVSIPVGFVQPFLAPVVWLLSPLAQVFVDRRLRPRAPG